MAKQIYKDVPQELVQQLVADAGKDGAMAEVIKQENGLFTVIVTVNQ